MLIWCGNHTHVLKVFFRYIFRSNITWGEASPWKAGILLFWSMSAAPPWLQWHPGAEGNTGQNVTHQEPRTCSVKRKKKSKKKATLPTLNFILCPLHPKTVNVYTRVFVKKKNITLRSCLSFIKAEFKKIMQMTSWRIPATVARTNSLLANRMSLCHDLFYSSFGSAVF